MTVRMLDHRRCTLMIPVVAVLNTLAVLHSIAPAQTMPKDFDALRDTSKIELLMLKLEQREEAVRNVKARFVTLMYNVELSEGKTGARLSDNHKLGSDNRYDCELARRDGNYRMSIAWFVPEQPDRPTLKAITSMDVKSGVSRSIATRPESPQVYGAIDTIPDSMIEAGRFFYWFADSFHKEVEEYPILYLLKKRDLVRYGGLSEQGLVRISITESEPRNDFHDTREVLLDPEKGYLPVRIHRRWEFRDKPDNGVSSFSDQTTQVAETKELNGVWFPTHIVKTVFGRWSSSEGFASVYDTSVEEITLGDVTPADLEVHFPEDAKVHDKIRGQWHVVRDGTLQGAEPLGLEPQEIELAGEIAPSTDWLRTVGYVVVGTGLLLLFMSVVRGYRRKKRGSV
ncbi:MAG: hypothetical protein GY854_06340 [Deltaproteobacteria bacterium]|nr:hypothetical protein [Deltaproteobacteria bacterium]